MDDWVINFNNPMEALLAHYTVCSICKAAVLRGGTRCAEGQRLLDEARAAAKKGGN